MEQPKITFNLNVFEVHKLVDLYNTNEKELDALWSASGVDLFRVIHNIVYERDRNTPPHKIWPYILSMMIAQLLYRKDDYRQSSLPPQQKIALYLQSLLGKLEISPRLLSSYPERCF